MADSDARRTEIEPLLDLPLTEDETWYLVSARWFRNFKSFYGIGRVAPGAVQPSLIENAHLTGQIEGTISTGLTIEEDYVVVHEKAWDLLVSWFGNDVAFPRKVVLRGINPIVDVYPQPCEVRQTDASSGEPGQDVKIVLVARSTTGQDLPSVLKRELELLTTSTIRVWIKPSDAEEYALVDPGQSMDELAGNDSVTELLVETQAADGTWTRASASAASPADSIFPAPVTDLVAWRAGLKVGDYLDAQDTELKWYDSKITEACPSYSASQSLPLAMRGTAEDKLRVHFMGWGSTFDMWFLRSSARLQPLFTKRKNWRDFRVNDKIEMKHNNRWYAVNVEEVDRVEHKIRLRPCETSFRTTIGDQWKEFFSDDIADCKTHIKSFDYDTMYNSNASYYSRGHTRGSGERGVVGLNNLGNTCFMASMLQCLSNTQPLTDYFTSGRYLTELNKDNPLGCGGHLAEAYGQLMKDMWSGDYSVVSPNDFKFQIGKKAPQFQGYQQQDSQELMSFLMDGLNEDLNRVLKKPYVEDVESEGRPDGVVADLSWDGYRKRNDSVICDYFAGQLRSHVKCNVCDRESTTFDPYLSLSVPIPTKDTKPFFFVAIPKDGGVPVRYRAEVNAVGCVGDVMQWYSTRSGIPVTQLLVATAYSHNVNKFMQFSDALSDLYRNDLLLMYQVPELEGSSEVKQARKQQHQEESKRARVSYYAASYTAPYVENEADVITVCAGHIVSRKYQYSFTTTRTEEAFGTPVVVPVYALSGSYESFPTGKQLHDFVWEQYKRSIKPDVREQFSVDKLPYRLYIMKKTYSPAYSYATSPALEYSDEVVDTREKMLYAHFLEEHEAALDLDGAEAVVDDESMKETARKDDALTLYGCFKRFNDEEQLGEMNMWYCSKCKEHRQAYKRMGLWRLPEVLIVHLKRFQYSQGQYFTHREKIEALVDFPIAGLDLSPYTLQKQEIPPIYDLFAVSNHSGGLGGGHYTAYGQNFLNKQWYDFNDSSVHPVGDVSRVVSPMAYVLFYRRRAVGAVAPVVPVPPAVRAAGGAEVDSDGEGDMAFSYAANGGASGGVP